MTKSGESSGKECGQYNGSYLSSGFRVTILQNKVERNVEDEPDAGIISAFGLAVCVLWLDCRSGP